MCSVVQMGAIDLPLFSRSVYWSLKLVYRLFFWVTCVNSLQWPCYSPRGDCTLFSWYIYTCSAGRVSHTPHTHINGGISSQVHKNCNYNYSSYYQDCSHKRIHPHCPSAHIVSNTRGQEEQNSTSSTIKSWVVSTPVLCFFSVFFLFYFFISAALCTGWKQQNDFC